MTRYILPNARSLTNKLSSSLNALILSSSYTIFCFTETWLSDFITDNEVIPQGFTIYRKDRPTKGGGILVAVKKSIPSVSISTPHDIEVVAVKLPDTQTILCTVYVPPSAHSEYHTSLQKFLSSLFSGPEHVVIVGDFNCPDICWSTLTASSDASKSLCDLIFQFNLLHPTHNKGNILDLIIAEEEVVSDIAVGTVNLQSDHFSVTFKLRSFDCRIDSSKSRLAYDYSKGDWEGLCDYLLDCDFSCCFDSDDVEQIWSAFKQIVTSATDLYIPKFRLKAHQPKMVYARTKTSLK